MLRRGASAVGDRPFESEAVYNFLIKSGIGNKIRMVVQQSEVVANKLMVFFGVWMGVPWFPFP